MFLHKRFNAGDTLPKWGEASAGGTQLPPMPASVQNAKESYGSFGLLACIIIICAVVAFIFLRIRK